MDGILIIDKPQDWTSHNVVDFIRKRFRVKKAGHAGTLDPMATGVLVVLLGRETKSSNRYLKSDKEYLATMTLGTTTDTSDERGRVVSRHEVPPLEKEEIERACAGFKGEIQQIPPMFSAVKRNGKKLYQLARRGVEVARNPRKVTIRELEVVRIDGARVTFRVVCSSGTYVRTLAEDIGKKLGYGAHLSELRRLRSGTFTLDDALTVERLKDFSRAQLEGLLNKVESREQ